MSANDTQVGGNHYNKLAIQPWDAMEAWLTPEEFRGYLKGCVIKYMAREGDKGGPKDIAKAEHYSQKLREFDEAQAMKKNIDSIDLPEPSFPLQINCKSK